MNLEVYEQGGTMMFFATLTGLVSIALLTFILVRYSKNKSILIKGMILLLCLSTLPAPLSTLFVTVQTSIIYTQVFISSPLLVFVPYLLLAMIQLDYYLVCKKQDYNKFVVLSFMIFMISCTLQQFFNLPYFAYFYIT